MAGTITKRTHAWTTKDGTEKSSSKWQADFTDRTGERHRKSFGRKVDAQNWLDEQTAGLVTGQWASPRAGRQRFAEYAEDWRTRQIHSRSTESNYESVLRLHLNPALGVLPLDQVSRQDVQKLVKSWVTADAAPATVHLRYTVLSTIFQAAVAEKRIPMTPCTKIALPAIKQKSALVPIGTPAVLGVRSRITPRYRALVTVAAGTGMRRGELLGLTLDRVSFTFKTIRVDRQLVPDQGAKAVFAPPKTAASVRTIPVAQAVLDAIREHVEEFGLHESGIIFTSTYGNPISTTTLAKAWNKAAAAAGVSATPHALRHYYASIQIRGGQSIKVLQGLLGHKSATETLDTYGHLMGDEDDRSRELVDLALSGRRAQKPSRPVAHGTARVRLAR